MEKIQHILEIAMTMVSSDPVLKAVATLSGLGAIDIAMRVFKTQKPLDLMIVISKAMNGLSKIFILASDLCMKVSGLLDKFLPQRTKDDSSN